MCREPVMPRDLAARSEDGGFESALPCRKCEGCLKFQQLQLRRRLAEHFGKSSEALWLLHISAPLERHAALMRLASRTLSSCALLGFCRAGVTGFALIVSGRRPRRAAMRGLRPFVLKCVRLVRPAKLRAWRDATRGVAISRSEYGAWTKRFYFRGLPQLAREPMVLERRGGVRKRHCGVKAGFRAWRNGLTLYAPSRIQAADLFRSIGLKRLAAAAASPVKSRRAERGVPGSSAAGFWIAGARTLSKLAKVVDVGRVLREPRAGVPPSESRLNSVQAGRDAGSLQGKGQFAFDWLERMQQKARDRGG